MEFPGEIGLVNERDLGDLPELDDLRYWVGVAQTKQPHLREPAALEHGYDRVPSLVERGRGTHSRASQQSTWAPMVGGGRVDVFLGETVIPDHTVHHVHDDRGQFEGVDLAAVELASSVGTDLPDRVVEGLRQVVAAVSLVLQRRSPGLPRISHNRFPCKYLRSFDSGQALIPSS
jgi:hypothetical protein